MKQSYNIEYIKKSISFVQLYCKDMIYNSKRILDLQHRRDNLDSLFTYNTKNKKLQRLVIKMTNLIAEKIHKQERWITELAKIGYSVVNIDKGIVHIMTYDSIGDDPIYICVTPETNPNRLYYHQIYENCYKRKTYWR